MTAIQTAGIDNRHASGGTMGPRNVARALRRSYRADLGPAGAFLPHCVPVDRLAPAFDPFLAAAAELPARYHAGAGGVRRWLSRELATPDPGVAAAIEGMSPDEGDALMTVLSLLGHAFRWDELPPAPERFAERRIPLPPGLAGPWSQLARSRDHPPVGTTWSMHLTNWRMTDRPGGSAYRTHDLTPDNVRIGWNWLLPPVDSDLDRFSVSFVLLEAKGAPILASLVRAIEAGADRRSEDLSVELGKLHSSIDAMTRTFASTVRRHTIDPAVWLSRVQPTFAWSAEAGAAGLIEGGPSGMQVGIIQALDAALGVEGTSTVAAAATAGRRMMPVRHRRFLRLLDLAGPLLRTFVGRTDCCELTERYNRCIRGLVSFRATHHSRGATYLSQRPEDGAQRVSTGLTIGADDDALEIFDATMSARIAETRAALLPR